MQGWRKRKGSAVFKAVLGIIALIAIPLTTHSQQAGAATGPPGSNLQQNPTKTDGQQSGASKPANTNGEKARLAVNPITGLTVSPASNFTPLTGKERWKLYWKQDFFSVGAYFKPIFFALVLDQTTNSPSEWGGGFSGFGLRVASRTASNIVQGTIRAPLAAALHEDVRYISDQRGGKRRRILHGVEYSFLTYDNQGRPTLNISKLAGYYASTAISTTWRPGQHPLGSYTLADGSEQVGLSVPINVLQEFWPDLFRKIARRR
jgi:hypothetical protein